MKKDIVISVEVDENHVPDSIEWSADDSPEKSKTAAVMISLWDKDAQEAMRIDLWDKQFTTDEMKSFFLQTLMTMNDTLERATGDTETCAGIREFGLDLGRRFGLMDD